MVIHLSFKLKKKEKRRNRPRHGTHEYLEEIRRKRFRHGTHEDENRSSHKVDYGQV